MWYFCFSISQRFFFLLMLQLEEQYEGIMVVEREVIKLNEVKGQLDDFFTISQQVLDEDMTDDTTSSTTKV